MEVRKRLAKKAKVRLQKNTPSSLKEGGAQLSGGPVRH